MVQPSSSAFFGSAPTEGFQSSALIALLSWRVPAERVPGAQCAKDTQTGIKGSSWCLVVFGVCLRPGWPSPAPELLEDKDSVIVICAKLNGWQQNSPEPVSGAEKHVKVVHGTR